MIKINLLPFRTARKKENIRRQVSIFMLSLVLVFLVMGVVYKRMDTQVKEGRDNLARLQTEARNLENQAREVGVIRRELELLEQKLGVLESLETGRRGSVEIFEALTEAVVPQRMWLLNFKEDGGSVRMAGLALDDTTVADFMTNLEKSGFFSSVSLESVRQQMQGNIALRSFSLVCQK
ncbi:type IV pilus assembly protein PilN [Desulfobotulus alkaliphilus]|uniref:Type IV pilus assembly protein PilN n=1 Tax=Desulfobotulus alkaliphilus TaxID=622671 RepID=A0A562S0P1_9BACT|nr:PilN domain-containing protein [Desulfobotulus alkaliphilus]TWI74120.1 type IV pilus assembly protein PilN [Desulfobotulus alkaliphilus]